MEISFYWYLLGSRGKPRTICRHIRILSAALCVCVCMRPQGTEYRNQLTRREHRNRNLHRGGFLFWANKWHSTCRSTRRRFSHVLIPSENSGDTFVVLTTVTSIAGCVWTPLKVRQDCSCSCSLCRDWPIDFRLIELVKLVLQRCIVAVVRVYVQLYWHCSEPFEPMAAVEGSLGSDL